MSDELLALLGLLLAAVLYFIGKSLYRSICFKKYRQLIPDAEDVRYFFPTPNDCFYSVDQITLHIETAKRPEWSSLRSIPSATLRDFLFNDLISLRPPTIYRTCGHNSYGERVGMYFGLIPLKKENPKEKKNEP
jgi:hypothetical protein